VSAIASEGEGEARPKRVVIPFTAPIFDDWGRLTYLGRDGLRYGVAD
jgi:hypothetical protein